MVVPWTSILPVEASQLPSQAVKFMAGAVASAAVPLNSGLGINQTQSAAVSSKALLFATAGKAVQVWPPSSEYCQAPLVVCVRLVTAMPAEPSSDLTVSMFATPGAAEVSIASTEEPGFCGSPGSPVPESSWIAWNETGAAVFKVGASLSGVTSSVAVAGAVYALKGHEPPEPALVRSIVAPCVSILPV